MSHSATSVTGGQFSQISEDTALFMVDENTLPPTVCPELLPEGWQTTGEVMDFEFQTGDWREVYVLERAS